MCGPPRRMGGLKKREEHEEHERRVNIGSEDLARRRRRRSFHTLTNTDLHTLTNRLDSLVGPRSLPREDKPSSTVSTALIRPCPDTVASLNIKCPKGLLKVCLLGARGAPSIGGQGLSVLVDLLRTNYEDSVRSCANQRLDERLGSDPWRPGRACHRPVRTGVGGEAVPPVPRGPLGLGADGLEGSWPGGEGEGARRGSGAHSAHSNR